MTASPSTPPLRLPSSVHRAVFALLALMLIGFSLPAVVRAQSDLGLSSKRYIVIDADTGEIIAEQNADKEVAIASLTKMFTTIEALERGRLDQRITTKTSDLFDANSTLMGFGAGETFTLEELLYGMMLPSGNDAAHAVARSLGAQPGDTDEESVDRFVGYMNERATNMGLTNTQFKNPHGWGVDGHYSTARDVATFAMYAMEYPEFARIIGTSSFTTADGNYTVTNTNKLLNNYSGLIGGKTGYDDDSGYCLVEFAERDGSRMISVTLDGEAPDIWYQDNASLLDLGFETKARRIADNQPITAETLAYVDPDIAVIQASTSSGGSMVGASASEAPVDSNPAAAAESGSSTSVATSTEPDSSEMTRWLGLAAVLLLVATVVGWNAWRSHTADKRSDPAV